jgi:hypothetical protein
MAKVLFVVTGATYLVLKDGAMRGATGYWAEEFALPYLPGGHGPRSAAIVADRLIKILG